MAGNLEFIKSASGTSVSTLEVTDCFSDKYDVYAFAITKVDATSDGNIDLRFIDSGGSVISDAEYDYALLSLISYAGFGETKGTNGTKIENIMRVDTDTEKNGGSIHYIFNPYDSSSYTFYLGQSGGAVASSGLIGTKAIGVHKSAEQITGFQFLAGSYDTLTVNVYGVK
jgi:hypothetical protein